MTTVVELPHVGESVTEGVIGKWLVEPGQRVERYDPLVEVITDKVSMEAPSPYAGVFVRALVAEGDTVPMGQPICEMDVDGEAPSPSFPPPSVIPAPPSVIPAQAGTQEPPSRLQEGSASAATRGEVSGPTLETRSSRKFEFVDSNRSVGPTGSGEGGQGRPDAVQDAVLARKASAAPSPPSGPDRRHVVSPLVAKLAAQYGIDSSALVGSGAGGRVTKDDVLRAAKGSGAAASAPPVSPQGEATSTLPLTAIRKTIAEHMARSAREIPAAWSMVEADASGLVRARTALRAEFERSHRVPLTYLPFAAKVVAAALREHPRLNARWDGDHITLNHRVHLGVASSTEAGLIVPVLRNADAQGIAALAVELSRLIGAARTGSLKIEDVQRGTFTLNNTGALGSVVSVPIINHPQAAILTTEAIVKRPVVVGGDAIAVRSMMNLCLAFDHRVCDGAEAGAFLRTVKEGLEAIDEGTDLD